MHVIESGLHRFRGLLNVLFQTLSAKLCKQPSFRTILQKRQSDAFQFTITLYIHCKTFRISKRSGNLAKRNLKISSIQNIKMILTINLAYKNLSEWSIASPDWCNVSKSILSRQISRNFKVLV